MQWIKRRWRRVLAGTLLVIAIAVGGFVAWASVPIGAAMDVPAVNDALTPDETVNVTERGWLAFFPMTEPADVGLVLYPGAKIPPEAYAPYARQIADAGYLVVVVHTPFDIAILNINAATPVIDTYSGVETWAVGGHSLGGTAASSYATNHPQSIDGLVLLAARPFGDALAARDDLDVLSLYGTEDGLQTLDELDASRANLPADTRFIAVEGGNHAQFGYYGAQPGDNPAGISRADQTSQAVTATIDLLRQLNTTN